MKRIIFRAVLLALALFQSHLSLADENPVISNKLLVGADEGVFYYPREIVFWNVTEGENRENTVFVRQGDDHPLKIIKVATNSKFLTAEIIKSSGKDYKSYSVKVSLDKNTPKGTIETKLVMTTDHPSKPEIIVPIYLNVLDGLKIDPPAFSVKLTRTKREVGGVMALSSTRGEMFNIDKIDVKFPWVITDVKPMKECCGYYIAVLVSDTGFNIRKTEQSSFVIHTDHDKQKMLVVPFMITAPLMDPGNSSSP